MRLSTPSQRLLAARWRDHQPPMIDGPLPLHTIRDRLVARMADDLVAEDTFRNDDDAIRLLMHKGYSARNVFLLVADARQAAAQTVVSTIMADSNG
jgi:hypothetical protein